MPRQRRERHDHGACVRAAVAAARARCGARLTPLRRRVLELIWASHRPIGAYALLETLGRERGGASPPTVYRALAFLTANGLAHRIATANAFVGCARPRAQTHASQFLLCADCGQAVELSDRRIERAVAAEARRQGFAVLSQSLEVRGRCPACGGEERADAG